MKVKATGTGGASEETAKRPSQSRELATMLVAMTLVGAALRLYGLGDQMLLGDELYTNWAVLVNDPADLPASVGRFDHSIPLTILFELIGHVTPVTEWMMRAPIVAFGIALPPLATLGARRFVGRDAALLLGFWLAVHPLFVFYGRFVRPYGIDTVLLMAVIVLLDRARTGARRADLAWAAVLGALAAWLHLLALLTAGLAFGGALLTSLLDARAARDAPSRLRPALGIVLAGIGCLALVMLLYLPALQGLGEHVVGDKIGDTPLGMRSVLDTLPLLAGLHGWGTGVAFAALGIAGLGVLGHGLGRRSLVLLVPAIGQPLLVAVLEPTKVSYGPVFARYLIFVLPIWLLGIASLTTLGTRRLCRRVTRPAATAERGALTDAIAAASIALLLLVAGPWSTIYAEPTSFAHSNYFQARGHLDGERRLFAWPPAHVARPHPTAMHAIYSTFANDAPLVVEWLPSNDAHYFALARAQMVHQRPVKIIPFRDFGDAFDLAREVSLEGGLAELPAGAALIVHRPRASGPGRIRFMKVVRTLREHFGEPRFDDDELLAFRVPAGA